MYQNNAPDTDVLIVGAAPVGLFLRERMRSTLVALAQGAVIPESQNVA